MIICSSLERVPDARCKKKTTKKTLLTSGQKMCGNEPPYNAVAQNLVESALRHRKERLVTTGSWRIQGLVNTIPCYIDRLDYSRKRLISKLTNDMQVRKPEK